MPMDLSERKLFVESVAHLLAREASFDELRRLRDTHDPNGMSLPLWRRFLELGISAMCVDAENGGSDLGISAAVDVMEQLGTRATASPFMSVALAAMVLRWSGNDALRKVYLPRLAQGGMVIAPALQEGRRFEPAALACRAVRTNTGWELNGDKSLVPHGHLAEGYLVSAALGESPDIPALFLVDASAPGVASEPVRLLDSHLAARVRLRQVTVPHDHMLGMGGAAAELWTRLAAAGAVLTAAELRGVGVAAFDITRTYLGQRMQFGQRLESFQALQHRLARLHAELELSGPVLHRAACAVDEGTPGMGLLASVAKAKSAAASGLAVREAVQLHGGIGMTDEYDLGFLLKRQRVVAEVFGDERFHVDRVATIQGY